MLECLNQKSAGAGSRVENRLTELRINGGDDELHDRARRVEFAGIAGCIPHFAEHRFVHVPQRVDLILRCEMNVVHPVDDIAQQIAVHHAVDGALKHARDHIPPIAVRALQ